MKRKLSLPFALGLALFAATSRPVLAANLCIVTLVYGGSQHSLTIRTDASGAPENYELEDVSNTLTNTQTGRLDLTNRATFSVDRATKEIRVGGLSVAGTVFNLDTGVMTKNSSGSFTGSSAYVWTPEYGSNSAEQADSAFASATCFR